MRTARYLGLFFLLLFIPTLSRADISITLKNDFIEANKDRATLAATLTVHKTHHKAKPASEDGDIHAAGAAPEIGLPLVAEIMNAKSEPAAIKLMIKGEETGEPIKAEGVWRIWCEHGGEIEFVQGDPVEVSKTTNPDHVFEIHPLTRLGNQELRDHFGPIQGYKYKDAEQAFIRYEQIKSEITLDKKTTTVRTQMAGFNYVKFKIDILDDEPHELQDGGLSVFARVLDLEGDLLVSKRRMIFVKDSPPWQRIKTAHAGDVITVLGIPRMSLALLSWRIENAKDRPEVLEWDFPYEMVIVGTFAE